jgi:hypothetical protein
MMELVICIPIQFRVNADGVMLRITRSSKLVTGLGQQAFARKSNKLPRFSVMVSFNAEGASPPPMIAIPNSRTAMQVFVYSAMVA